jgi:hypothetical protein
MQLLNLERNDLSQIRCCSAAHRRAIALTSPAVSIPVDLRFEGEQFLQATGERDDVPCRRPPAPLPVSVGGMIGETYRNEGAQAQSQGPRLGRRRRLLSGARGDPVIS